MPCLRWPGRSSCPEPWAVADWGPALTPADPAHVRPGLLDRLAGGRGRGRLGLARSARRRRPGATRRPTRCSASSPRGSAASRPEETSLGEWLTRLDAGRWPIVVDRVALASAGWGPRSRVVPPRVDAATAGVRASCSGRWA